MLCFKKSSEDDQDYPSPNYITFFKILDWKTSSIHVKSLLIDVTWMVVHGKVILNEFIFTMVEFRNEQTLLRQFFRGLSLYTFHSSFIVSVIEYSEWLNDKNWVMHSEIICALFFFPYLLSVAIWTFRFLSSIRWLKDQPEFHKLVPSICRGSMTCWGVIPELRADLRMV